jgi:hypothetical protein
MPSEADPRLPVDQAARLYGLLADETRLLLRLAVGKDQPVTALAKELGVSLSPLCRHLTFLRLAGVVSYRREGHHAFYALAPGPASGQVRP